MDHECPYCGPECPVGYGKCHCGCGDHPTRLPQNRRFAGVDRIKGQPYKYVQGHHNKAHSTPITPRLAAQHLEMIERFDRGECPYHGTECDIPLGTCHCGCGRPVKTISRNNFKYDHLATMPYKFRSGHHCRRLTEAEVREIRLLYGTTNVTQKALAARFGVSQVTISKIALFDRWKEAGVPTAKTT